MPRRPFLTILCLLTQPLQAATFSSLPWIAGESQYSEAWGLSGDGTTVVGSVPSGSENNARPVRWVEGVLDVLPLPATSAPGSGPGGQGLGISRDGSVVVGTFAGQAFHWSQESGSSALGSLSATAPYASAMAVSGDGSHAVGQTNDSKGGVAFQWSATNGLESLGRLPGPSAGETSASAANGDASIIVGSGTRAGSPSRVAVIWVNGIIAALPAPSGTIVYSDAFDISGRFVCGSVTFEGAWPNRTQAVIWNLQEESTPRVLPSLEGASQTIANAVSATGIAGGQSITGNTALAVLWDQEGKQYSLLEQLEASGLEVEGWQFLGVTGISEDGLTLTGNAINPDGLNQAWIVRDFQFVPEPCAPLLLVLGSAVPIIVRRRRLKHDEFWNQ